MRAGLGRLGGEAYREMLGLRREADRRCLPRRVAALYRPLPSADSQRSLQ